jgi:GrpB-like predicted nucleotidyltransferase (UPF0157 family)
MDVYKFRKYETSYPKLYLIEKRKIARKLKLKYQIAHIGSTSVPKLSGKGIIDIIIAVSKKDFTKAKKKILTLGYEQRNSNDKSRLFFRRETKIRGKERRYHLHLTYLNHTNWKEAHAFRQYLVDNPKIAKKYEEIKKKAIILCKGDGQKYRELKNGFIRKYTDLAMKSH